MLRLVAPLALASTVLLAACGGKSNADPDAGGSNSGGNSSGGSGMGGSSHAGTNSGGKSTGGAGSQCDSYSDATGLQIAVMISNEKSTAIHLGSDMTTCGIVPLFNVVDAAGEALGEPIGCRSSCQEVRTSGGVGCPTICLFPTSVTLEPGEGTIAMYSGLFSTQAELPVACLSPEWQGFSTTCDLAKRIEPGTYTFSARAGTTLDCSQTTGGVCGACMSDSTGGCKTPGSLVGGDILSTEATVELGPAFGVFAPEDPPPNGNSGAGAAPSGMLASVQLVFRD